MKLEIKNLQGEIILEQYSMNPVQQIIYLTVDTLILGQDKIPYQVLQRIFDKKHNLLRIIVE